MAHQDELPMVELAKLSSLAYYEWGKGYGAMSNEENFEQLVKNGKYSVVSQNWTTGGLMAKKYIPQWTVFELNGSNLIIIAVKGTALLWTNPIFAINDILLDLQAIVGGEYPTKMVNDLTNVVKKHQKSDNDRSNVMITGHSLGGYAAEVMSTTLNIAGAGFCAPGPNTSGGSNHHDGLNKHPGFRCINAYHDLIGNLRATEFVHLQLPVYAKSTILEIPVVSHSVDNMVKFLEGCTSDITNYNVYEYAQRMIIGPNPGHSDYTLNEHTIAKHGQKNI